MRKKTSVTREEKQNSQKTCLLELSTLAILGSGKNGLFTVRLNIGEDVKMFTNFGIAI